MQFSVSASLLVYYFRTGSILFESERAIPSSKTGFVISILPRDQSSILEWCFFFVETLFKSLPNNPHILFRLKGSNGHKIVS